MEFITEYLKRNVKLAAKSVFFHFRQYLCFFFALFIVQSFYGIITIAADNSNDVEYQLMSEEYDYDIVLKDLNSDQYVYMLNDEQTVFEKDHIHDLVRVTERDEEGSYNAKYDMYIKLYGDDRQSSYRQFQSRYYSLLSSMNPDGLRVATSPMINFESNLAVNTASYVLFSLLLTVVSVFFLMSLYGIRLNHYRFTYGVYMSFGADFKKLFENSFWEMMVISLCTFIPASGCAFLTDYLIYTKNGVSFTFHQSGLLKILLFSLLIAAASVILPVYRLSRRTPMSLIIAEDNSNLVISPRRSFEMFGVKLPVGYELRSLWRFRKYNVKLLCTSVVFAALFMSVFYFADIYETRLNYPTEQFRVKLTNGEYVYDDEMREELYAIDGVTDISKQLITYAEETRSHMLVNKSDVSAFSLMCIPEDDSKRATNKVSYSPADEEIVEYLKRYDYDGDLSGILTGDNMVIVSDSYDNSKKFNLKPGDTISLAKFVKKSASVQDYLSGNELLSKELEYYKFDYTEYTVCAVIHDNPTFRAAPVYMSNSAYTALTGNEVVYKNVGIFIDPESDIASTNKILENLREWADIYGATVGDNHTASLHRIEAAKNKFLQYTSVAVLILLISPLMWFFTQTLYYLKRENEFSVMAAFGAIWREIRGIYLTDGIFDAIGGVVIGIAMNFTAVFGIYKFMNVIYPKFIKENIRYEFAMPALPLLAGCLVSIACGFLSAYIPYLIYRRKRTAVEKADAAVGDEFDAE